MSTAAALFPFKTDPVTGDHPVGNAKSAYGSCKAQCERVARRYQAANKPVVTIYPGMVVGPDDWGESTQIEPAKLWLTKPFPVSDSYTLSIIDVRDIAAVVSVAMKPGRGPKRYVMFGHYLTSSELYDVLCDVTGRELKSVSIPKAVFWLWGKAGDLTRRFGRDLVLTSEAVQYMFESCAGDNSFTESDTGIKLRPIQDSLRDLISWLNQANHITPDQAGQAS